MNTNWYTSIVVGKTLSSRSRDGSATMYSLQIPVATVMECQYIDIYSPSNPNGLLQPWVGPVPRYGVTYDSSISRNPTRRHLSVIPIES